MGCSLRHLLRWGLSRHIVKLLLIGIWQQPQTPNPTNLLRSNSFSIFLNVRELRFQGCCERSHGSNGFLIAFTETMIFPTLKHRLSCLELGACSCFHGQVLFHESFKNV